MEHYYSFSVKTSWSVIGFENAGKLIICHCYEVITFHRSCFNIGHLVAAAELDTVYLLNFRK